MNQEASSGQITLQESHARQYVEAFESAEMWDELENKRPELIAQIRGSLEGLSYDSQTKKLLLSPEYMIGVLRTFSQTSQGEQTSRQQVRLLVVLGQEIQSGSSFADRMNMLTRVWNRQNDVEKMPDGGEKVKALESVSGNYTKLKNIIVNDLEQYVTSIGAVSTIIQHLWPEVEGVIEQIHDPNRGKKLKDEQGFERAAEHFFMAVKKQLRFLLEPGKFTQLQLSLRDNDVLKMDVPWVEKVNTLINAIDNSRNLLEHLASLVSTTRIEELRATDQKRQQITTLRARINDAAQGKFQRGDGAGEELAKQLEERNFLGRFSFIEHNVYEYFPEGAPTFDIGAVADRDFADGIFKALQALVDFLDSPMQEDNLSDEERQELRKILEYFIDYGGGHKGELTATEVLSNRYKINSLTKVVQVVFNLPYFFNSYVVQHPEVKSIPAYGELTDFQPSFIRDTYESIDRIPEAEMSQEHKQRKKAKMVMDTTDDAVKLIKLVATLLHDMRKLQKTA